MKLFVLYKPFAQSRTKFDRYDRWVKWRLMLNVSVTLYRNSFNFSNTPFCMLSKSMADEWKFIRLNNLLALQLKTDNFMGNTLKHLTAGQFKIDILSFEKKFKIFKSLNYAQIYKVLNNIIYIFLMHVLKCKGTKYDTKKNQKKTHTKNNHPPPKKTPETNMRLSKPFLNS